MKFGRTILLLAILALTLVALAACVPEGYALADEPAATWSIVLTLLVPFIAMLFQQAGWDKKVNTLILFVLTLAASLADILLINGTVPTPGNIVVIVMRTLVNSYVLYTVMKELGLADWVIDLTTLRRFSPPYKYYRPEF